MANFAPRRIELCPWADYSHKVGTYTPTVLHGTTLLSAGLIYNAGAAINDEIGWYVDLDAGTWSFQLIHQQFPDRGIYTVKLDAATLGTIDGYNAVNTVNVVSTIAGFTVASQGVYLLKFVMASKNVSSTSYLFSPHWISLWRTGA